MINICLNSFKAISKEYEKSDNPYIISVAGGTATCKSTIIVPKIVSDSECDDVEIISKDNFQQGRDGQKQIITEYGHDTPEYFEVDQCYYALSVLKNKNFTNIPIYNYNKGILTKGERMIKPKKLIVFDLQKQ